MEMPSVKISKTEYEELKARASAYDRVLHALENAFSLTPPERSKRKIVAEFRKVGKYSPEFLSSLERGLSRSSHFRA